MRRLIGCSLILLFVLGFGCAAYEYRAVPIKNANSYSDYATVLGATVAARVWTDPAEANQDFGFDILGAGLIPVEIVVDNEGVQTLEVNTDQTWVEDSAGDLWEVLPAKVVYDRVNQYVYMGRVGSEAARSGALGTAAGAILGAAIGIISEGDVGRSVLKGAAVGAATGAVIGGANAMADQEAQLRIADDLRSQNLKDKPFPPDTLSHGFLFFPGEIQEPVLIRLQLREVNTQQRQTIELRFIRSGFRTDPGPIGSQ
jgi:hypothetical protein